MAGRSSSRHKREIQGRDSSEDTPADHGEASDFNDVAAAEAPTPPTPPEED